MAESSEFGAGIVVCLAKFSEHLQDPGFTNESAIREFARWDDDEAMSCAVEAKRFPSGDAAQKLARMGVLGYSAKGQGKDWAISKAIEMWANGASDHFYDLDDKAPPSLKMLAEIMIHIAHGFSTECWTIATLDHIRDLWKRSCLEVDKMLGVEPDWGEW